METAESIDRRNRLTKMRDDEGETGKKKEVVEVGKRKRECER